MSENQIPEPGTMEINGQDLNVTPIPTGKKAKFKKLRSGAAEAVKCLAKLDPALVVFMGLNAERIQAMVSDMADYKRAEELRPAAEKMVEQINHTQRDRGTKIAQGLGEMAKQARTRCSRAPDGDAALAKLNDLMDYHYGPAVKGKATRQKAKAAKEPNEPK